MPDVALTCDLRLFLQGTSCGFPPRSPDEAALMLLLAGQGLVVALGRAAAQGGGSGVGPSEFCLTADGAEKLKLAWKLERPFLVCALRPEVPLEDRTLYELILLLRANGWRWQLWLPESRRNARTIIPPGYRHGDDKVWFSGRSPWRPYLMCLLKAEDLHCGVQCSSHCNHVLLNPRPYSVP